MTIRALRQYLEQLSSSGIRELYLPQVDKGALLNDLQARYSTCAKCPLALGRIKFVYGEGNPEAIAMIIGEGPGDQENRTGRPFVGEAGKLLDRMLAAINIQREEVYIANIVKCRPPGNRNPESAERQACLPYLLEQIWIIKPRLFLMLGLVAAQTLLESRLSMENLRRQTHLFQGIKTYVTYHPAALLRNPHWKRPAWEDLQRFQKDYEALTKV